MITKNKLSGRPSGKLTEKFNLGETSEGRSSVKSRVRTKSEVRAKSKGEKGQRKSTKFMLLLLALLLVVAGVTFGVITVVRKNINSDAPASEIPPIEENTSTNEPSTDNSGSAEGAANAETKNEDGLSMQPITNIASNNPTIKYGRLMLINPNFMVDDSFIAARKSELISLSTTYGILELHSYNGDNLIDKEAGAALAQMLGDYAAENPGHAIKTVSCFRSIGTSCGRLCMPTGASDHHTGLTCDLIDPAYGESLDTDTLEQHLEWQWLKANSYKYGFIDRFPEAWAGGSMAEPMNVNAEGSTGLYETWHYRYVGTYAATQIATGVYNNGKYDSLEHYLLARGLVTSLLNGN